MTTPEQLVDPGPVTVGPPHGEAASIDRDDAADAGQLLDPGPIVAVAASAEADRAGRSDGDEQLVDPGPVTAVATVPAAASLEHDRSDDEARAALRTLADLGVRPDITVVDEPDNATLFQVVEAVARRHGADHGTVELDPDGEGVRVGIGRFSLAAGELGAVLTLARARDADALRAEVGELLDELLAVTTAATREGRSAPVGGTTLWSGDWPARMRRLAGVAAVRHAQNEQAVEHQLKPLVPVVSALGGEDGRALAVAYDRALATGVGAAVEWLVATLAPTLDDDRALAALGMGWADVRAATRWLPAGGGRDPLARAAVVGLLRAAGRAAPIDVIDRLSRSASDPARAASLAADTGLQAIRLQGRAGDQPR